MRYYHNIIALILAIVAVGCTEQPSNVKTIDEEAPIFPDYAGVTIPVGIAPLNFNVEGAEKVWVDVKGSKEGEITGKGEWAIFDMSDWKELLEKNREGSLTFEVYAKREGEWVKYKPFEMTVSADALDEYGVTYRRIAPGYEVFSDIGVYQRDIHTYDEEAILDHRSAPGECMNCHVSNRTDPRQMQLHVRGMNSATLIQIEGKRKLLNTATDSTIANCMYPYWHPSGNYIAYSLNLVHQCFNESNHKFIEVFDKASDALVLDVRTNQLVLTPSIQTENFESYPVFSADGKKMYYCSSKAYKGPEECEKIRYDLCAVDFDEETGHVANEVDTLIRASAEGKSITHPRPSYDGKWLLYSEADFGVFPLNHPEADLWLMEIATGKRIPLAGANSDGAESYHNWSTNSRWIVFCSRRIDGVTNRLFFTHVDEQGNSTKAFLLPQYNPKEYYENMIQAYNTPDFTLTKVDLDIRPFIEELYSGKRIQVSIK